MSKTLSSKINRAVRHLEVQIEKGRALRGSCQASASPYIEPPEQKKIEKGVERNE